MPNQYFFMKLIIKGFVEISEFEASRVACIKNCHVLTFCGARDLCKHGVKNHLMWSILWTVVKN